MADGSAGTALIPFGFTGLESQIYAYLAAEAPATGYRISQAIGKPVANTYKAIQTLQAKGAIIVEDGDARLCRAVASGELLDRLTREFERRQAKARETFAKIAKGQEDDHVYSLRSKSQAMQRARTMLGEARQVALAAARGPAIQEIQAELADAAARGVEVVIKSDTEVSVARVDSFVAYRPEDLLRHGSYFCLVVDGSQYLAGTLEAAGEEAEMIWSQSRVLAMTIHEGLAAELTVLAIAERLEDGAGPKRLARALTQIRPATATSEPTG